MLIMIGARSRKSSDISSRRDHPVHGLNVPPVFAEGNDGPFPALRVRRNGEPGQKIAVFDDASVGARNRIGDVGDEAGPAGLRCKSFKMRRDQAGKDGVDLSRLAVRFQSAPRADTDLRQKIGRNDEIEIRHLPQEGERFDRFACHGRIEA